jgi:four helix bundle protein
MDKIAEGYGSANRFAFIQFLNIAFASAAGLTSQIYRSSDREYLNKDEFTDLYEKTNAVYKKINGFIQYLNTSNVKGTKFKDRNTK